MIFQTSRNWDLILPAGTEYSLCYRVTWKVHIPHKLFLISNTGISVRTVTWCRVWITVWTVRLLKPAFQTDSVNFLELVNRHTPSYSKLIIIETFLFDWFAQRLQRVQNKLVLCRRRDLLYRGCDLWPPCVANADIIFSSCGFYLSSIFFFPRLISAVA